MRGEFAEREGAVCAQTICTYGRVYGCGRDANTRVTREEGHACPNSHSTPPNPLSASFNPDSTFPDPLAARLSHAPPVQEIVAHTNTHPKTPPRRIARHELSPESAVCPPTP